MYPFEQSIEALLKAELWIRLTSKEWILDRMKLEFL